MTFTDHKASFDTVDHIKSCNVTHDQAQHRARTDQIEKTAGHGWLYAPSVRGPKENRKSGIDDSFQMAT